MTTTIGTTLPDALRKRAAETPDRPYVVDVDGRQLTYREAVVLMARWAAAYRRIGVRPGEHVVTMQFNTLESLGGWLGLSCIGAIEAAINTDYRGDLLAHALNITRTPTMLVLKQYLDRVLAISADVPHLKRVIVLDADEPIAGQTFEVMTGRQFLVATADFSDEGSPALWDIAAILFTSGTTGPSKAVRIPWGQLYSAAVSTLPFQDLGSHDVIYNPGPTYHIGAKLFPMLSALIGGHHVMRPYISESQLPDEFRKFGITTGGIRPPFVWLDEAPAPGDADCVLRNMLLPVPLPRLDEFKRRFGVRTFSLYNMTEMSNPIADKDWDIGYVNEQGLFSCGMARAGYPGYEVRIVDEWDQQVEPGVVGELIVRTAAPWTMNAGYLNNPEATAAAWRNGWFHTGDAFSYDKEGRYYFRDRIKDCIRRRAENISSFEVEAVIRKHPEIADCAAVAAKLAERPAADEEIRLIVVRAAGSTLDAEALVRWLIPRMPRFMIPRFVEFMDVLPRTPTLKVQKVLLRERPMDGVWDRELAGIELPR